MLRLFLGDPLYWEVVVLVGCYAGMIAFNYTQMALSELSAVWFRDNRRTSRKVLVVKEIAPDGEHDS